MVPKCELLKIIPLHVLELNYGVNIFELEDHVGEEALSSYLPPKFGPTKRILASFSNYLLKNI
jgi:hypothetical protein